MSRNKKPKAIRLRKPMDPQRRAMIQRMLVNAALGLAILAGLGFGVRYLHRYVDRRVVFHQRAPKVVLKDRPLWMSDFLADQIARAAQPLGAHSTFDHQLLIDVAAALKSNPWIKEVRQVRRAYATQPGDTIEIDCVYRVPLALVHWKDYYWLVDSDGVKLPEQFTEQQLRQVIYGQNQQLQFRIIEGVRNPPVESGRVWPGDDLAAGLTLAQYLWGQSFAEEVVRIDVANFGGRENPKEAQLVLLTKRGSEIRWGRPVNAKDFFVEVSVAQKLEYMRRVHEQYGRIDANQPWIDIRFDKITCPSGEPQARLDGLR